MRRRCDVSVLTIGLVCVAALIWCAPAVAEGDLEGPPGGAQTRDAPDGQEATLKFGLQMELTQIGASSFSPQDNAVQRYAGSGYIYSSEGDGAFWTPVTLPAGSLVFQTCVWLYDTTANNILVEWGLYTIETDGDLPGYFEIEEVTNSTTSGYHWVCLNDDYTIRVLYDRDGDGDAERINYRIAVYLDETTSAHRLGGVQVAWVRQISPAPGTATFNDVDLSHPAFQEIEAIADSGIMTGFPGGNFAPDAVITRAQMATSLARALGLHWPN